MNISRAISAGLYCLAKGLHEVGADAHATACIIAADLAKREVDSNGEVSETAFGALHEYLLSTGYEEDGDEGEPEEVSWVTVIDIRSWWRRLGAANTASGSIRPSERTYVADMIARALPQERLKRLMDEMDISVLRRLSHGTHQQHVESMLVQVDTGNHTCPHATGELNGVVTMAALVARDHESAELRKWLDEQVPGLCKEMNL